MDLKKAFLFAFEDKQWLNKAIIAGLISIVPILNFTFTGYIVELMRRVMKGEEAILPNWDDLGKKFVDGLLLFVAEIIYILPFFFLVGIPMALLLIPIATATGNNQGIVPSILAVSWVTLACLIFVFLLYKLALIVAYPAIVREYAKQGTFASLFNIREIIRLITKNTGDYFTAWGVSLGAAIGISIATGVVGALIGWIPCVGQLAAVAAGAAGALYTYVIFAHLFGQVGALDSGSATMPVASTPIS